MGTPVRRREMPNHDATDYYIGPKFALTGRSDVGAIIELIHLLQKGHRLILYKSYRRNSVEVRAFISMRKS